MNTVSDDLVGVQGTSVQNPPPDHAGQVSQVGHVSPVSPVGHVSPVSQAGQVSPVSQVGPVSHCLPTVLATILPLCSVTFPVLVKLVTNKATSSPSSNSTIQLVTSLANDVPVPVGALHSVSFIGVPFNANFIPNTLLFPASISALAYIFSSCVPPDVFLIAKVSVVPNDTPLLSGSSVAANPVLW